MILELLELVLAVARAQEPPSPSPPEAPPVEVPSESPSETPSETPSQTPSEAPAPSETPSEAPSEAPASEGPAGPDVVAPAPVEAPIGDPIDRYRTRFDVLAERAIGSTSVPVAFDWRKSPVELAACGSFLFEQNNFGSGRGGLLVRVPTGGSLIELGLTYAAAWDTPSSQMLALTPYRQPGRPDRLELDVALGLPLAEGVVTTRSRLFPAVEMVFTGYVGLRYLVYPTGFGHMKAGELAGALFAPTLTEIERANLEEERLDAMQLDPARYGVMLGFGDDLYFAPGLFVSPRLMFALPILAPATETELLWWADVTIAVGVAL